MEEIVIDTSELEPPAPMQLVLSQLQSMIPNYSFVHQIHRLEPVMVFNRVKPMGIEYLVKKEGDLYHIYYFYPQDREEVLKCLKG
ncbi:MAG: hypothetical protein GXO61_04025 [Epsilonproteobacteria bacterium]|nr:hypothetical protein [Campylobacterota bacterium]